MILPEEKTLLHLSKCTRLRFRLFEYYYIILDGDRDDDCTCDAQKI